MVMMLSVVSVLGVVGLSFYHSKMVPLNQLWSSLLANDTNRISEKFVIEDAVYHPSTQTFNVTSTNTGFIPIDISHLQIKGPFSNSISSNATQVGGSSCNNSPPTSIQYDYSNDATASSVSSVTFSHKIGTGTNKLLLVGVSWQISSGNPTISQVTYAGQVMTLIADITGTTGTTHTSIYGLLDNKLSSGTANVIVTLNGGNAGGITVGSLSVFGADQTSLPSNAQTNSGSPSGTASVTITTNSNSWIFETVSAYSGPTLNPTNSQTQKWSQSDPSGQVTGAGGYNTQSGTLTESWSINPNHSWSMAAVEIKLSASSGGCGSGGESSSNPLAIDNTASNSDSGTHNHTTLSVTLSTSNANDVIMVVVSDQDSPNTYVQKITDTVGLTFYSRTTYPGSGIQNIACGNDVEIWYAIAPSSLSSDSITVTMNTSPQFPWGMVAFGISGANTNSPFDGSDTTNSGSGCNTYSSATVSRSANSNDMLIGALVEDDRNSIESPTALSGMTMIQTSVRSGSAIGAADEQIASTSNSYTVGFNLSPSDSWALIATAVKPVSQSQQGSSSLSGTSNCLMLPGQTCTMSVVYHCFSDPVTISATTSRGNTITTASVPNVSWYNSQWQFRKEITINNAEVNGTLYNFPVLINIYDQGLLNNAQSSGSDIVFTACDGKTPLNYEIEKYNAGSLQAWVEIPALYSSPNDVIYMYYGNHNNILPHVTLTLTNSQNSATPVPFQQEITFNPSQYMSSEATNLGNIRFCADTNCNTQFYSWLETCTPSCTNTATQATAWVQLTSAIPANGANTIYMVFQPTSKNFDDNYWGESYQAANPNSFSNDNIAKVMNTGLLTQIYWNSASPNCSSSPSSDRDLLYSASLGNNVQINGCEAFLSAINPYATAATGSNQAVYGISPNQNNVIINYASNNYNGGTSTWPNPPVITDGQSMNVKTVGWIHVPSSLSMSMMIDDGGLIGTTTATGGFTTGGADWLGGKSNPRNLISVWVDESNKNYTSSSISSSDYRIEADYYNGPTDAIFAMASTPVSPNYYSFTYPPNGVMPTVTTNVPWDSNYVGVWHFKEDPSGTAPQMKDSTSNGNHLTSSNMLSVNQVSGKIDGSLNYASLLSSYLSDTSATNIPVNNGVQTESAWFLVSSNPNSAQDILTLKTSGDSAVKMGFTSQNFAISTGGGSTLVTASLSILSASTWHYVAYTYDGITNILYIDGAKVASSTSAPNSGAPNSVYVGTLSGSGEFFNGQIDETRVSNIVRSSSWIYTEYNNQVNPNSFLTVGIQQAVTDPRTMY
jgi:hypothetical protein